MTLLLTYLDDSGRPLGQQIHMADPKVNLASIVDFLMMPPDVIEKKLRTHKLMCEQHVDQVYAIMRMRKFFDVSDGDFRDCRVMIQAVLP